MPYRTLLRTTPSGHHLTYLFWPAAKYYYGALTPPVEVERHQTLALVLPWMHKRPQRVTMRDQPAVVTQNRCPQFLDILCFWSGRWYELWSGGFCLKYLSLGTVKMANTYHKTSLEDLTFSLLRKGPVVRIDSGTPIKTKGCICFAALFVYLKSIQQPLRQPLSNFVHGSFWVPYWSIKIPHWAWWRKRHHFWGTFSTLKNIHNITQ